MSVPEQAGKAIEALKGSPGLLVLVLLQLGTMALLYLATQSNQERDQARELALIERCYPLNRTKE